MEFFTEARPLPLVEIYFEIFSIFYACILVIATYSARCSNTVSCCPMLYYAVWRCPMQSYAVPCSIMLYNAVPCHPILSHAVLCCPIPSYAVSSFPMLSHTLLCFLMLVLFWVIMKSTGQTWALAFAGLGLAKLWQNLAGAKLGSALAWLLIYKG